MNRRSGRRKQRRALNPHRLLLAVELRHQRLHLRHIARWLSAPFSTVVRTLNRLISGRHHSLNPNDPLQRYESQKPGDLIDIDVKQLARFRQLGHRITANRQQSRSTGVAYDRCHGAIEDATRHAYVEGRR